MFPKRHRFKWSINEILTLHREYELLGLRIQDIANNHERTFDAIIHKLIEEDIFCDMDINELDDNVEDDLDNDHLYDEDEDEDLEKEDLEDELEEDLDEDLEDEDLDEDLEEDLDEDSEDDDNNKDLYVRDYEDESTEKKELSDKIVEISLFEFFKNRFNNYFYPEQTQYVYKIFY
jgi:hypothetical protein